MGEKRSQEGGEAKALGSLPLVKAVRSRAAPCPCGVFPAWARTGCVPAGTLFRLPEL